MSERVLSPALERKKFKPPPSGQIPECAPDCNLLLITFSSKLFSSFDENCNSILCRVV